MKILLLGATGYLGGNIVNRLSDEGHYVICIVRPTSDCSRIDVSSGNVELVSNNLDQIELKLREHDIDWVINGVCTYKPNASLYGDMLESNLIFPLSILNLAIKYHVKNYMTMGTGLPDDFNVYSFTKHEFAEFGRFLSEKDHINFLNLKLEMFYGGFYEPASRFMKSCHNHLLENEPLELTAGTQKRDLVRVEDVIEIISLLVTEKIIKGYKDLQVGSGESHSIRDIICFMKEKSGSHSMLNFGAVESRLGEPDTCADISWLSDIGYKMKFSFWDGLLEYVEKR